MSMKTLSLSALSFTSSELLSSNALHQVKGGATRYSAHQRMTSSLAPIAITPTVNSINAISSSASFTPPTVNDTTVCYGVIR